MDSKQGFSAPRPEEEKECNITRPGGGTISLRGSSVECCKMSACAGNDITADEQDLINRLHKLLGDRWPLIAGRLPWRRVEEIENYCKMRTQEGHRLSTSATRS